MTEETITLAEAGRNFSRIVARSHYQGVTYVITTKGHPVVKIVPASAVLATPVLKPKRTYPSRADAGRTSQPPPQPQQTPPPPSPPPDYLLPPPTDPVALAASWKANEQRLLDLKDAEILTVPGPGGFKRCGVEEVQERKLRLRYRAALAAAKSQTAETAQDAPGSLETTAPPLPPAEAPIDAPAPASDSASNQ